MSTATKALVLDVDGVISPVFGRSAWLDDVVAGHVFGPVVVSPTMCHQLDRLAAQPGVITAWLTSWSAAMRNRMQPFPGRSWPQVADPTDAVTDDDEDPWWKWTALQRWLDTHPDITHLAWVDDHLAPAYAGLHDSHAQHRTPLVAYGRLLAQRSIASQLLAPATDVGLTPAQLTQLEAFLAATPENDVPPRG